MINLIMPKRHQKFLCPACKNPINLTKWNFILAPCNRCNWPRGKVLGGSSVLNYMLYVRGNRRDYDSWAANGNTGWSYDEVLPYFLKSEDNRNPYLARSKYHGTDGYLTVQEAPYRTPLAAAFIAAGEEMGYKNRDCNGEFQTGFMLPQGKHCLQRLFLLLSLSLFFLSLFFLSFFFLSL